MKGLRRIQWHLVAVAIAGSFVALRCWQWLSPKPPLAVGRDTTFLTEPLRADGCVDYVAAWTQTHSEGVTPVNNAAPPLFAAMGLPLDPFPPAEVRGITSLERPFLDACEWAEAHPESFDSDLGDRGQAMFETAKALTALDEDATPPRDLLAMRAWLAFHREALDAAKLAGERTRFFIPISTSFSERSEYRSFLSPAVEALLHRARVAAIDGGCDAAASDVRACVRLARLLASTDLMEDRLDAMSFEDRAWKAAIAMVRRGGFLNSTLVALVAERDPTPFEIRLHALLRWHRVAQLEYVRDDCLNNRDPLDPNFEFMLRSGTRSEEQVQRVRERLLARRRSERSFLDRIELNELFRALNAGRDRCDAALSVGGSWPERFEALGRVQANAKERTLPKWFPIFLASPDRIAEEVAMNFLTVESGSLRVLVESFVAATASSDIAIAEIGAIAYAGLRGQDPRSTDALTQVVFAEPFRDRLLGTSLAIERDERFELRATGPLVDLLRELEAIEARR